MDIAEKNILVVGDSMLDVYIAGDVKRISPEAPIPVLRRTKQRSVPGGAANVAANLVAAGQRAILVSLVGEDESGQLLRAQLGEKGIESDLVTGDGRPTITKTRYVASNNQQILRVDEEDCREMSESRSTDLLEKLESRMDEFDALIISDYLKGLLTPAFTTGIISLASRQGVPVFIDAKDPNALKYRGATLIKPNLSELGSLTGLPVRTESEIIFAANALREECECEYVLATMGARGMLLVDANGVAEVVPATAKEVFDVSGAGDTSIAYLATCVANGMTMRDAVRIANVAAGVQVSKAGTSSVFLDEVEAELRGLPAAGQIRKKTVLSEAVSAIREENSDKAIVFTNGCFDILHVGHVQYLKQAATMGDLLIVGVNSDASVAKLKGPSRPINPQTDRAAMLSLLDFVDYVVVFDEETPYDLITALQPDILVKGGDYNCDEIVGCDVVKRRGGSVVTIPFVEGKSSTAIIDRIIQLNDMRNE